MSIVQWPGYIYVVVIPNTEKRNLVKIGGTKREPSERIRELYYEPQYDFFDIPKLHFAIYVNDVWGIERYVHSALNNYYIGTGEAFEIHPDKAAHIIMSIVEIEENKAA